MTLMGIGKILRIIGSILVLVAWLGTDNEQIKFILLCGAYVFASIASYIFSKVAEQRKAMLKQLAVAIERKRMFTLDLNLPEKP